ncbi:MAG: class I SAM-dependent methyltransferase [Acidimicrobiia bacterium]
MDSVLWDERYREADLLWSPTPNLFVADRLGPARPGTGVDLASGEGRNAIWLSEKGWSMTAVDFSEVAIERGAARSDDVEFVVGDVRTWTPNGHFDLVLISYLQLTAQELRDVVVRASGWLGPGGELFMIGHDRSNIEDGHGGPQVPEILWDVDEIASWLDHMVLTEALVVRRPVETDAGTSFARDSLIRARAQVE